jgi:hypothetical protein
MTAGLNVASTNVWRYVGDRSYAGRRPGQRVGAFLGGQRDEKKSGRSVRGRCGTWVSSTRAWHWADCSYLDCGGHA